MKTPFPGVDPYLESPRLWPDVHNSLISAACDALAPALPPNYYVAVQERTYTLDLGGLEFLGLPDIGVVKDDDGRRYGSKGSGGPSIAVTVPVPEHVRETWLQVCEVGSGEVITVLEVLSPSNKRRGRGRRKYLRKRAEVLDSLTHLVEVDLLRDGQRMPLQGPRVISEYRILISRGDKRPRAELLPFGVRDAIPRFPLPLRRGDKEPEVDLGGVLHALYERRAYHKRIDYRAEAVLPLSEADRGWAHELLLEAGVRRGA